MCLCAQPCGVLVSMTMLPVCYPLLPLLLLLLTLRPFQLSHVLRRRFSIYYLPTRQEQHLVQMVSQASCWETLLHSFVSKLTFLFNLSLRSGKLPSQWKVSNVIPIFKSGDPSNASNYRPISLLPLVSKVLECIIFNRISHHLYQQIRFA